MPIRFTKWAISLTILALFCLAIWQAANHWAWLEAQHLAGVAVLEILALGILTLAVPIHLNSLADSITPGQMVRDVAVRSVLMLLAFTGISFVFVFIGFLLTIPARLERPYLLLPGLLIIIPIIIGFTDIIRGIIQRTPANLFWSWAKHSFEIYYLILIQLGTIPIAFLLFPAGFFLQIISLIEGAIRLFSDKTFDSMPLLCEWANVSTNTCAPTLVTFHIGHLILAFLGAKYGMLLLDKAADGYAAGLEWLGNHIKY